jgi:membrane-bound lytic murein transglycosylase B
VGRDDHGNDAAHHSADVRPLLPETLASIANYLHRYGWKRDAGWRREVAAPPEVRASIEREVPRRTNGCGAIRALTEGRALADGARRGVRAADASPLSASRADASLVTVDTRTFLVSSNHETILGYNCSHRYALSVSLLAERLE